VHEMRLSLDQHEGPVWHVVQVGAVVPLPACLAVVSLPMELRVDLVGADLPRVEVAPQRAEPLVVPAAAECTRAMPGSERGRLVEEEELGELARLEQRMTVPAAEGQAAGDPASPVVAPADPPVRVVETASVAVDEAARRIRDELAERRDAVLERHCRTVAA